MNKLKYLITVVMVLSILIPNLTWGNNQVFAADPPANGGADQQTMPRMGQTTNAERRAAAQRAAAARAALGDTIRPAVAPGPGTTPDYFGTTPNWAFSPIAQQNLPTVTFSAPPSGTSPTATAIVSLYSISISLTVSGSGYDSAPTVTIVGGGGSGASATAVLGSGATAGKVIAINLINGGSGYTTLPTIKLSTPDQVGGVQAVAIAALAPVGAISGFNISSPGSGYLSAPTVTLTGGGGTLATATAVLGSGSTAGQLAAIYVTTGGSGYGALLRDTSTAVTGVLITNQGTGYTSEPTVTFTGGGGSSAAARVWVALGKVNGITITNGGSGYTTVPSVTITGGGGSGATGTAIIAYNKAIGIRKFVDSLPGLTAAGANDLGQYIPVAVPDASTYPGTDYYEIALVRYTEQMNKDLPPTELQGYIQTNTIDSTLKKPSYLGPLIITQENRPVRIKYTNLLPTGTDGNLFIPVDTTVMGSGMTADGVNNYTQNRSIIHLHGGVTPWISDGTPHQWTTPATEVTDYPKGVGVKYVPDMWYDPVTHVTVPASTAGATNDPGPGSLTFYYTNAQSARLQFYHDHSYGITRLNVYTGQAAGYIIRDTTEQNLINTGVIPSAEIPLIIQDRTFVPGPAQLATEDPTWDPARWGGTGNLWFPHVYMPNQNPADASGTNAMGRWDYGPWFWPPYQGLINGPKANPYYVAGTSEGPTIPGVPDISLTPEAFMDTPVVNGTAYPYLTIEPKAYRFRILNASNDRALNLSLFYAASNGQMWDINGNLLDPNAGEVPMVPAAAGSTGTTGYNSDQLDGRAGGIPDIRATGPEMYQIGTEGGILPATATIVSQPIGYEYFRRSITVLNISTHSLLIGPAERADVIVDFSQVPPGSKLILYNDAPTPVPAFDSRTDYYTGDPDQTDIGGAPTTQPGYGPNTRTIMQFQVAGTPSAAYNKAALDAALPAAFAATQPKPIIPLAGYDAAYGASFPADQYIRIQDTSANIFNTLLSTGALSGFELTYGGSGYTTVPAVTITGGGGSNATATAVLTAGVVTGITLNTPGSGYSSAPLVTIDAPPVGGTQATAIALGISIQMQPKAIQELFETQYGRMNATLGVELPNTNARIQTTIPYGYIDPPTELMLSTNPATLLGTAADGTQIWKITHNGVDTHFIHFHLFNVQVINRVGWDGTVKPPDANELGWKETVRMNPLEDIVVAMRATAPNVPFKLPNAERNMDVASAFNSSGQFSGVDPGNNPVTVTNVLVNFGFEYVWHCHILGHEENDMMRPIILVVPPDAPTNLQATRSVNTVTLTWKDNSANETGFVVQRATNSGFSANLTSFDVNPSVTPDVYGGNITYTDTLGNNVTTYYYRVLAANVVGYGNGYPQMTANSAYTSTVTIGPVPSAPTGFTATVAGSSQVNLQWVNHTVGASIVIQRATNAGFTTGLTVINLAAGATAYSNTGLTPSTTYYYRIYAVSGGSASTMTNSSPASVTTQAAVLLPAAPTGLTYVRASPTQGNIRWTLGVGGGTPTGIRLQRATNTTFTTGLVTYNLAATTRFYTDTTLVTGRLYYYRVYAFNAAGNSAYSTRVGPLIAFSPAAEITPMAVPDAPTGLTATADSATQVSLLWTDNNAGETSCRVERATDAGFSVNLVTFTLAPAIPPGPDNVFYVDTPVVGGTEYFYRVIATNIDGDSAPCDAVPPSVTTPTPAVPADPSGMTAVADSPTQVSLTWVDNSTDELGFRIERALDVSFTTPIMFDIVPDTTVYTDTSVPPSATNTDYYYRVFAYNAAGDSTAALANPLPVTVLAGVGPATQIIVETAADGSGTLVPRQALVSGNTLTAFAITRDEIGQFVANDATASWSLNKTGLVANSDLSATSGASVVLTGRRVGTAIIQVTSGVLTSTDSGLITVEHAVAYSINVETAANGSGSPVSAQDLPSGSTLNAYAITRDANSNFVANDAAATWSMVNTTGLVVTGDLNQTTGASVVMTGHMVGLGNIQAASGSLHQTTSGTIAVVAGAAASLTVNQAPTSVSNVDIPFDTQPWILVSDAAGNPVSGTTVTVGLVSGAGGLRTTLTAVSGTDGLAKFAGLGYSKTDTFQLGFTTGLLTVNATAFGPLTAGAAASLTVNQAPASTSNNVDDVFSTQPWILVSDAFGNPVSGTTVTAGLASGTGALRTTLTAVSGTDGLVKFAGLGYSKTDAFQLSFTGGGQSVNATAFGPLTAGAAASLTVNQTPASTTNNVDDVFSSQPWILVSDAFGNPVNGTTVTAGLASGTGALRTNLTATSGVDGLAVFTGLGYSKTDAFQLSFSDGTHSVNATVFGPLTVGAKNKLIWGTQPPSSVVVGTTWTSFTVKVADQFGNQTADADEVTIVPSAGTLSGTLTKTAVAGLATFSNISRSPTGSLTLTATSPGLATAPDSVTINIVAASVVSSGGGGGGGGSVPAPTPTPTPIPTPVSALGITTLGASIDANGEFKSDVVAEDVSGDAYVTIVKGVKGLTSDGKPLPSVTVLPMANPPAAPEDSQAVGLFFDFGPSGANFSAPVTITLAYDPAKLAAGIDPAKLYIAWYDTTAKAWVKLTSVVDPVKHTITATVSHFTLYSVLAPKPAAPVVTATVTPTPTLTAVVTPTTTTAPTTTTPAVTQTTVTTAATTSAAATTSTTAPVTPAPKSKTNWGLILGILAAVLIVVVVIMVIVRRKK